MRAVYYVYFQQAYEITTTDIRMYLNSYRMQRFDWDLFNRPNEKILLKVVYTETDEFLITNCRFILLVILLHLTYAIDSKM